MSTVRIQVRRGLAAEWPSVDPILAPGELGLESDTNFFKFGNGTDAWSALPYANEPLSALQDTLADYVLLSDLGQPNGAASLNSSGKVPADQLDITELSQDAVNGALTAGSNIVKDYNDIANTITISLDDSVVLTGDLTVGGASTVEELTINGNLTVNGTTTTVSTANFTTEDALIYIGENNTANSLDLGIVGSFDNGTYQHSGLVRDASDGVWKLFSGVIPEPGTTVDFTTHTRDALEVGSLSATNASIGNVSNAEIQHLDGVTSGIQFQLDSKLSLDTAESVYAPIISPTFTGTVSGITKTMVGLSNVDNTADLNKPISTATQTALDTKAPANGPTFTGNVSLPGTTSIGNISPTELGYVDGVTSSIQTQLDSKLASSTAETTYAPIASPSFTGTVVLPSSTSIGTVSATEIGYLDGVTSSVQTQIGATNTTVSNHASATTSVHGIADTAALATKTYADTAASTAVSTHEADTTNIHGIADTAALATKTYADTAASTAVSTHEADTTNIHGIADTSKLVKTDVSSQTISGALTITGNLTVQGTTTTVSTTNFTTADPVIYLGEGNNANVVDLGFVASYNDGTYAHQGLVKDTSDNKWKFFKGVTDEPTTTVNFAQGSLDDVAVNNLTAAGVVFTDGTQTKQGVPSLTPIISKTASYTLSSLTERDSMIEVNSSSATTITIPTNASVAFPIGASIDISQISTGQVTIAGAGGVTVNATPGLKLRTQWSTATLFKRGTDSWLVYGDLTA